MVTLFRSSKSIFGATTGEEVRTHAGQQYLIGEAFNEQVRSADK
jgi:hypothetical protein